MTREEAYEAAFKDHAFAIGQMVHLKQTPQRAHTKYGEPAPRPAMTVINQMLERCHGGVQRHYSVRMFNNDPERFSTNLQIFCEVELEAADPAWPDVTPPTPKMD